MPLCFQLPSILNAFIELLIFFHSHHAVVLLRHGNHFRVPDKWFSFQIHFKDEWSCAKNGVSFGNERRKIVLCVIFFYLSPLICFLVTASLVLGPFYHFYIRTFFYSPFCSFQSCFCCLCYFLPPLFISSAAGACCWYLSAPKKIFS